ncbi:hypothetical protein BSKO_10686 [Bryopsis sp. KO-2023]|nr:hypothetical protein BSKO_10686 [Bryopsis sp. KO-2023]
MESDASADESTSRSPLPCSERCKPCLGDVVRYWPVEKESEQCGAGLEEAEKFLAKTDITREGLVRCWLAVRKRLMKGGRDCGGLGQARKEAVSRYLEKKRRRELKFLAEELANEDLKGTVMEIDF